jgi:pimeloyl-ACP methyl ester carboxylesterase
MGGGVALMTYFKVAEDNPGRIKSLVLIDSAGYPQKMPWFIRLAGIPLLNSVGTRLLSPRFAVGLVLRKCYYRKEKITDEQIDAYAYYGSLPGGREALVATAQQIVPEDIEAVTARYQTIKVPVLIIWGEEDEVVPVDVGRKFKRDIPNSELVILPQCGHIPQEEEPGVTTRTVEVFLKK